MCRVPRLPVWRGRFERGVACRDAFRVDRAHLRPVLRQHRADAHTGRASSLALLHRSLLRTPKSLSRSRTREAPVVPPCLRHARSPGNGLHSEGTGPARPIPRALITVRSPARASSPVRVFARATRWPIRHPRMYRLHSHRRLSEHRLGAYYSRSQSFWTLLGCCSNATTNAGIVKSIQSASPVARIDRAGLTGRTCRGGSIDAVDAEHRASRPAPTERIDHTCKERRAPQTPS